MDLEDVLRRSVQLLAQVTEQAAVVQLPNLKVSRVKHCEVVALSPVRLLLVLSASAGMVDAVSLLGMERVLASNIAGNLVFAALAGAGVPGFALLPCCTALAAYAAGAAAAGRIGAGATRPGHGLVRAAAIESALLILAGFLVLGLERAGLLTKRRVGRQALATGDVEAVRSMSAMLTELEGIWRGRVARMDDLLAEPSGPAAITEETTTAAPTTEKD